MARTNPEMLAAFLALINTQMERKRDRSIAEEGRAFELAMNKMLLETRHKQEQSNVFLEQRLREISTIQERISKKKDDLSALGILSEGIKSTGAASVIEQSVMKGQATITKDQQEVTALEKDAYSNLGQKKVELTDYENTLGKLKADYDAGFADDFTAIYIVEAGSTAHPDWIASGRINSEEYNMWRTNLPKGSPTDRLLYATFEKKPAFEQGVKARAAQVAMENVKLRQPQIERAIPTTHISLTSGGKIEGTYEELARAIIEGTASLKDLTPTAREKIIPILNSWGYSSIMSLEKQTELRDIQQGMRDVLERWGKVPESYKGYFEGAGSKLLGAGKWQPDVARFEASSKIIGMQLTRLYEKGRISDQDRIFYLSLMPNLRMNKVAAEASADELIKRLETKLLSGGNKLQTQETTLPISTKPILQTKEEEWLDQQNYRERQ